MTSDRDRLEQIRRNLERGQRFCDPRADLWFLLGLVDRQGPFKQYFEHLKKGAPLPQKEYEAWWVELESLDNACCGALGAPELAGEEGRQQ